VIKNKEIVKRVTQMAIAGTLSRADAAELLKTSARTISNYKRRYTAQGARGLIDRRHGNYRKLTPEAERQIVECKMVNGARSACWIRNRLKLEVSVETVRRVLVKHNLKRRRRTS
jgi:transposase